MEKVNPETLAEFILKDMAALIDLQWGEIQLQSHLNMALTAAADARNEVKNWSKSISTLAAMDNRLMMEEETSSQATEVAKGKRKGKEKVYSTKTPLPTNDGSTETVTGISMDVKFSLPTVNGPIHLLKEWIDAESAVQMAIKVASEKSEEVHSCIEVIIETLAKIMGKKIDAVQITTLSTSADVFQMVEMNERKEMLLSLNGKDNQNKGSWVKPICDHLYFAELGPSSPTSVHLEQNFVDTWKKTMENHWGITERAIAKRIMADPNWCGINNLIRSAIKTIADVRQTIMNKFPYTEIESAFYYSNLHTNSFSSAALALIKKVAAPIFAAHFVFKKIEEDIENIKEYFFKFTELDAHSMPKEVLKKALTASMPGEVLKKVLTASMLEEVLKKALTASSIPEEALEKALREVLEKALGKFYLCTRTFIDLQRHILYYQSHIDIASKMVKIAKDEMETWPKPISASTVNPATETTTEVDPEKTPLSEPINPLLTVWTDAKNAIEIAVGTATSGWAYIQSRVELWSETLAQAMEKEADTMKMISNSKSAKMLQIFGICEKSKLILSLKEHPQSHLYRSDYRKQFADSSFFATSPYYMESIWDTEMAAIWSIDKIIAQRLIFLASDAANWIEAKETMKRAMEDIENLTKNMESAHPHHKVEIAFTFATSIRSRPSSADFALIKKVVIPILGAQWALGKLEEDIRQIKELFSRLSEAIGELPLPIPADSVSPGLQTNENAP
jgi:hypothetical protein